MMKIMNIKINNMHNPVGFDFRRLFISYEIDDHPDDPLILVIREDDINGKIRHRQALDYALSFCTDIDFVPEKESRYCLQIISGETKSEWAFFETGTTFDCDFITPLEPISHPVFFRDFSVDGEIAKARLYVTGLGLYEAFVNGQKAGNEFLTPGCNDYDAYLQYQTYDVTPLITKANTLEIFVGNGWYKGRFGLKGKSNIYGSDFVAAAKLLVWYQNGQKTTVVRTDLTWKARTSFVIDSGIYDGEIQNANGGDGSFSPVTTVQRTFPVEERISLPMVVKRQIIPTLIVSPKGEQILDFGQNMTGFVSFEIEMNQGQSIRLQAGEVLQQGCFYRDNLRSAKAEFQYTSDGIKREVRPHFTFYGFRYMLVEGLFSLHPESFRGNVLFSDLDETVEIRTDNAKINRLLENCLWGQRGNFVDVPTDCPQRDERLGWTGDAAVFSKTACYQMNCQPFYDKYLKDMKIDQDRLNGLISNYSPGFREEAVAGSVWADAATIIPWNIYMTSGDQSFLKKHYPLMERYARTLIAKDDEIGGKRLFHFGMNLGDWLSQDGPTPSSIFGGTDENFITSTYYYNSLRILADASRELGYFEKEEYFRVILEQTKSAILDEYFSPSGRLAINTQTAYAIAVNFDLYRNREKLLQGFAERLRRDSYILKGGFVGATQLIQALIKGGMADDAFRMLYAESFPSWLYCVNLGATTIWERWNSLNPDGSISGTGMNSLNHYAYGSVAEAFYAHIAGLRPLVPGFKKVVIEPKFNYRLRRMDFSYASPSGTYTVKFQVRSSHEVELEVDIPFGVEARLVLENEDRLLKGGRHRFTVSISVDLDHPFNVDSKLCDLAEDSRALDVVYQQAPGLKVLLAKNNGFHGQSLRTMNSLSHFATQKGLDELNARLSRIPYGSGAR